MVITKPLTIIFFGLLFFSCCTQPQSRQNKTNHFDSTIQQQSKTNYSDSTIQQQNKKVSQPDTIDQLLKEALIKHTLEFNNAFSIDDWQSFLFFKSGKFLNKTEKNALLVCCNADSTYLIKLYSIKNKKWFLSDSIDGLGASPSEFDITFSDYNFDKQTDIYIQASASQGWSLSRGYLLIIEPKTKKLNYHKEADDLANMTPEKKTKTVISELWNGYNMKGQSQLTLLSNKWINGQLKTISKRDIIVK